MTSTRADGQVNVGPAYDSGEPKRASLNYFDDIQIGTTLLQAGRGEGNRYKGRLEMYGIGDAHCELLMVPGSQFKGPGVMAQVLMMTPGRPGVDESQQRLGISLVRQSNNPDGSQGPDIAMLDMDGHDNAPGLPLFVMTGGKTHPDDSVIPGKLVLQISPDGTIEVWDQRGKKALRYDVAADLARIPK